MSWWSKCISMDIARTASRNVAFKVAKMDEALLNTQITVPTSAAPEVVFSFGNETLEDLGRNADLYIFNQNVAQD